MIKDFIKTFLITYQTIFNEKIKAKNVIKNLKLQIKKYENVLNILDDKNNDFLEIWSYLPHSQRTTEQVQYTLQLFQYGFYPKDKDINMQIPIKDFYISIIELYKKYLINMKFKYKKRKYNEVIELYDDVIKQSDKKIKYFLDS